MKRYFFIVLLITFALPMTVQAKKSLGQANLETQKNLTSPLYFDVSSSVIKDNSLIKQNARWMKVHQESVILLEGHCDERGSDEFNLELGDLRARTVMKALMDEGVSENQLVVVSFGKKKPLVKAKSEGGWAKNRRVEFMIR